MNVVTIKPARVSAYCMCGSSIKLAGMSVRAMNEAVKLWRSEHTDPECGPCTAQKAAAARRQKAFVKRSGARSGEE